MRGFWRIFSFGASLVAICFLHLFMAGECSASDSEASPVLISISSGRFSAGDDLRWASPLFDDSGWTAIADNAPAGSMRNHSESGFAWRRMRFIVPQRLKGDQPAILLGRVGDADEVYLNGVRIGGEGTVGDRFVRAAKVVRLYPLPPKLLNPEGENLLAVRTVNLYSKAKSYEKLPVIGDYGNLLKNKLTEESFSKNIEFVLFTFFVIWIEYCVFLYLKGMITNEYTSFGIFMTIYAIGYFLDSLTFYQSGFKTGIIQQIATALDFALPATILYFQSSVFRRKPGVWTPVNIVASIVLSGAALFLNDFGTQRMLVMLWYPVCVSSLVTALVFAWRDYRQKLHESGPMLAGMLWLGLSGGVSLASRATSIFPSNALFGFYQPDLILFVWIIIMKYGIVARFARIRNEMQTLSSRLLSAHEEERSRLARELHDGMGQNLVAVKLNLQRVNYDMESRLIDGVIEEVSSSINDLRDITTGLMPASLQAVGLAKTLTNHAGRYSKRGGGIIVEADDLPRLSPSVELNIFRIFQEALNNAVKHSGATDIRVSLRERAPGLIMQVHDNGSGFDVKKMRSENRGLGLSIMQERVRIIGGDITVQSGKNQGTTIRVEVPFS